MGSINAMKVAGKVSERLGKGQKVVFGEIMRESGYSKRTSLTPKNVTNTKTYRKLAVPLIEGLQEQITRIKEAIARKDLDNEELRVLTYSLDTLTKNYQLLSGGATERQVFVIPSEIMNKNLIESPKEGIKQLENGST